MEGVCDFFFPGFLMRPGGWGGSRGFFLRSGNGRGELWGLVGDTRKGWVSERIVADLQSTHTVLQDGRSTDCCVFHHTGFWMRESKWQIFACLTVRG